VSSGVGEPSAIEATLSFITSLLAPPRCGVCGARCSWREPLCDGCEGKIARAGSSQPVVPGVDAAWCAAPYEGAARDLVAALKFASRLALARRAAAAIAATAPPDLLGGEVVPVPPAPWRLRRRGHDPAEEIAFALARLTELPFRPVLARTTGPRQVGRRRADRLADPPAVRLVAAPPRRAVLLDDVITTGATLGACARALRAGGAQRVVAAAFARA
jgi:predicted amidophosphoribosyltransferase